MARRDEGLLSMLADLPWWVSLAVGAVCYVGMRFVIPAFSVSSPMSAALAKIIADSAWVSAIFLVPAAVSAVASAGKARRLDVQTGVDSIRDLPWKRFEELLGEAYRRQGFQVVENTGVGADGGVDLLLRRDGQTYLVQCKQWRTYSVGVKVVREMLGLVHARRANGAIVVTSGTFTQEARSFAADQPVQLVDGHSLAQMISSVQRTPSMKVATASAPAARICPRCGGELVVRQAKRGPRAGGHFLGCSGYPKCRYTEEVSGS